MLLVLVIDILFVIYFLFIFFSYYVPICYFHFKAEIFVRGVIARSMKLDRCTVKLDLFDVAYVIFIPKMRCVNCLTAGSRKVNTLTVKLNLFHVPYAIFISKLSLV